MGLFWPEEDEKTARHNLSQLLYSCKRQPWSAGLEVERQRLRWNIETDVRSFREALGSGAWELAATLYRGDLLGGVLADETPNYQDWLESEREKLQSDWRDAVLKHATTLEAGGEAGPAAAPLREVLTRDTLAEDVLQTYMRCAARRRAARSGAARLPELPSHPAARTRGRTARQHHGPGQPDPRVDRAA